jgi:hypothetical protein
MQTLIFTADCRESRGASFYYVLDYSQVLEILFEKVMTKTKPDVAGIIFEIVDGG